MESILTNSRVTKLAGPALSQAVPGPVVYWCTREQRFEDNWSLHTAAQLAASWHQPLLVVVALRSDLRQFAGTARWLEFMLLGLEELEARLRRQKIVLQVLVGDPPESISQLCGDIKAGAVVVDFYPLKVYRQWQAELTRRLDVPILEVDAHNCVPCRVVSSKQEYAARTIRPKLERLLPEYLSLFPGELPATPGWRRSWPKVAWPQLRRQLKVDITIAPVSWIKPGAKAAHDQLQHFITTKLENYATDRNYPELDAQSDLSPFIHFGHISAQRVAWEIERLGSRNQKVVASQAAFLEELIIRRELADNFCWYQPNYDQVAGFPEWARLTLAKHQSDPRPYRYSLHQLTQAQTHDPAWNAAQRQLVLQGKMHGYMRMYWAKKILEWTESAAEAMEYAISLNDRYELDGRDPNGYVGVAWSLGGVHDRPWPERPIFGTVRSMTLRGLERKINLERYIELMSQLPE